MQRDMYDSVTQIPVLIACSYGERDGMVNLAPPQANFKDTLASLHPMRALRDTDLNRNSEAGRKFWRALPTADQNRLLALIGMRQALEANDPLSVEKREEAYRRVVPELLAPMAGIHEPLKENFHADMARLFAARGKSFNVLERLLTHTLRNARLILWRKEKEQRLLPAIYCPDAATALYVRALLGIAGGKALLVCPHCGTPFLQRRSDQDYCSIRCREAHRVARWRAERREQQRGGSKKSRSKAKPANRRKRT
jgi:hypothetical protein